MDESEIPKPMAVNDGKLVQRNTIGTGNSDAEVSNLCVKISNRNDVLVGSELGCFVVSLEGTILSSLKAEQDDGNLGQVASAIFHATNSDVVYIANENIVLAYDMRESLKPAFCLRENSEEINQLCIQGEHLASCDDSGEVKIFDLSSRKAFRTLRKKHKNICSTICFRENAQKELLSGSLDCQLILWNYAKIKVLDTSNTQEIFRAVDGEKSAYMFNPPLINAIHCSNDGEVLACGTGNGCTVLYEISKGKRLKPYNILRKHSSVGVSCLNIFEYNNCKYLSSGGNDCKLCISEITLLPSEETESSSTTETSVLLPSKLNSLTSFSQNEKIFHLVCDQSSHLKLFEQIVD